MTNERKLLLAELRTLRGQVDEISRRPAFLRGVPPTELKGVRARVNEISRRLAELDEEAEAERGALIRRRAFHVVRAVAVVTGAGFLIRQVRAHPVAAATGVVALAAFSSALVAAQNDDDPPVAEPPGFHRIAPPSTSQAPPLSTTAPVPLPTQRPFLAASDLTQGDAAEPARSSPMRPVLVSVYTPPAQTPPSTQQPAVPTPPSPVPISDPPGQLDPPGPTPTPGPPGTQPCAPLLELKAAPILDLRLLCR